MFRHSEFWRLSVSGITQPSLSAGQLLLDWTEGLVMLDLPIKKKKKRKSGNLWEISKFLNGSNELKTLKTLLRSGALLF